MDNCFCFLNRGCFRKPNVDDLVEFWISAFGELCLSKLLIDSIENFQKIVNIQLMNGYKFFLLKFPNSFCNDYGASF